MFCILGQDEVVVFSEASVQLDECYACSTAKAQQLMVLGTVCGVEECKTAPYGTWEQQGMRERSAAVHRRLAV